MTPAEHNSAESGKAIADRVDRALVASLYDEHAAELRSFLVGVLRDPESAGEVLQITFVKAVELGHTAHTETLKGWLFRVAFHEAMAWRRRQAVQGRAMQKLADGQLRLGTIHEDTLVRRETVDEVRRALAVLPPEQQQVVRMRIYEEQTFAAIAEQLQLPLGTVLTRMQLALRRLRGALKASDEQD